MIEYEATFQNIEKEDIRNKLKKIGAKLLRPEFLQKRVVLLPPGSETTKVVSFIRVRDEGNKNTLTFKTFKGSGISDQEEIETEIGNFQATVSLLNSIGCKKMTSEESRRELWTLDNVEITIDDWPFLGPIVEVEGESKEEVKMMSEKLGFDWNTAKFCPIGKLYIEKYGYGPIELAQKTEPILCFLQEYQHLLF